MSDAKLSDEIRAGFQGKLIGPGDGDYDEARKIWNGMIDKRPALIAQCATTSGLRPAPKPNAQREECPRILCLIHFPVIPGV